jgi:hypothetical protein
MENKRSLKTMRKTGLSCSLNENIMITWWVAEHNDKKEESLVWSKEKLPKNQEKKENEMNKIFVLDKIKRSCL